MSYLHPDEVQKHLWSNKPHLWPSISQDVINDYLIESPACDGLPNNANKSLEAINMYLSGWVGELWSYKPADKVIYLRGKVSRSQATNEEEHSAWFCATTNGKTIIHTAKCSCTAGLGKVCSHVAAILFKLLQACNLGLTTASCTDVPMTWNRGTKRIANPQKMRNIKKFKNFDNGSTVEKPSPTKSFAQFYEHAELKEYVSSQTSAFRELMEVKGSLWNQTLNPEPKERTELIENVDVQHNVEFHEPENSGTCNPCVEFYTKFVELSENKIETLSKITVAQSGDNIWEDSRVIRITASSAHRCPKKISTDPQKFLKSQVFPTFKGNKDTNYGKKYEKTARQAFQSIKNCAVKEVGTIVCKTDNWLSASPDGIVNETSILEIKCPVGDLDSLIDSEKYDVRRNADLSLYLRQDGPRGYHLQCQILMHCSSMKHCYFYLWSMDKSYIINVNYDCEYITKHLERLRKFYFVHFLPYITSEYEKKNLRFGRKFIDFMSKK